VDPNQPVAQVDQVTINSGSSGVVRIYCNGALGDVTFNQTYAKTMEDWITLHEATFNASNVAVSGSGASAWLMAMATGVAFSPSAYITNIANAYRGAIKIVGNEIWENEEDNDAYGFITINRKGYNGGMTRPRHLLIGNGKGNAIVYFDGSVGDNGAITMYSENIKLSNIPSSDVSISEGMIYRDGTTLKIKTS
jgi:hypothetical protein